MTTVIPEDNTPEKMNLYFTFEFYNRQQSSRSVQRAYRAKNLLKFNSKWKYTKIAAVISVLQNTRNL